MSVVHHSYLYSLYSHSTSWSFPLQ